MPLEFKILIDRYLGGFLISILNYPALFLGRVLRRDHSLDIQGDILVTKLLGGGSLVMAFPALLGIRRRYPQARLRLVTTSAVKPFAETLGVFDEILLLDDKSLSGLVCSSLRALTSCFRVDTVIDFEIYSYMSVVFSLLTCARNRIGLFFDEKGFRQVLQSHRVFFHPGSPLYRHYDRIASLIGAPIASVEDCAAHMRSVNGFPPRNTRAVASRIAIGCGCSELSLERRLTPEQWRDHVFLPTADKSREIVFLGAASDRQSAEEVICAVKTGGSAVWRGPLRNDCGRMPLRDSLRLLATCDEFWGIESSLLHYARLFGVRCRAFLGPTHPMRLRPVAGLEEQIFYRKTLCSPCIHLVSRPPCHGDNRCMKELFMPVDDGDPENNWTPVVTKVGG